MTKRAWSIAVVCVLFCGMPAISGTRVAVMDLKSKGKVSKDAASLLTDTLRAAIYKAAIFDLMNREDMVAILNEVKFQQSGACDSTSCIVDMGNALGLEKIIAGSIGKLERKYSVTLKLVDIARARNEILITEYFLGSLDDLPPFIEGLAWKLVNREEELQGVRKSARPKVTGATGGLSPVKALLLSMALPGVGQHYNGQHLKGVAVEVMFVGGLVYAMSSAFKEDEFGNRSMGSFAIGVLVYMGGYLWGVIDAPIAASKINRQGHAFIYESGDGALAFELSNMGDGIVGPEVTVRF